MLLSVSLFLWFINWLVTFCYFKYSPLCRRNVHVLCPSQRYVLYVICRCVLYWGGVLSCVVYGVGVLWAISLYDVVLAFIFLMCWDFQGLLYINSFTCVLRVRTICDKSIFVILRCCFVMCCVWSRCFVSYLSLWWCICIYICGFVGSWKDLCMLFFRCILWCVVRVLCSCV